MYKSARRESHSLRHIFNDLQPAKSLGNQLGSCQSHANDLRVSLAHLIGHDVAVQVHRGPDVRVTHQLLLYSDAGPDRIEPTPVRVPQ